MVVNRAISTAAIITLVGLLAVGAALAGQASSDTRPTKGPVPEDVTASDGSIERDRIPDYVPALDRDGERAGYVESRYLFPDSAAEDQRSNEPLPVYDERLSEVVGHMYPGRGFVSVDADPQDVPRFDMEE